MAESRYACTLVSQSQVVPGSNSYAYTPIARNEENAADDAIVRWEMMRGGIVALCSQSVMRKRDSTTGSKYLSPSLNCQAIKHTMIKPKPSMQPQTFELCHGYVLPPHCRANSRHTMPHIRRNAPNKSICASFCLNDMSSCFRSGFLKKKKTVIKATAPKGRLIQKHLSRFRSQHSSFESCNEQRGTR